MVTASRAAADGLLRYDVDAPSDLRSLLDVSAARFPDRAAVIGQDRTLTYRELRAEVDALARRLRAIGILPGERVGLLAGSGAAFTTAAWATWELAAVLVPLNSRLTASDLATQVADSAPLVVLVGATRRALADELAALVDVEVAIQPELQAPLLADRPETPGERAVLAPADAAAILYTSGTTGRPKGVVISHANAIQNSITCTAVIGRTSDDVELVMAPQFNVTGLCSQTVPAVHLGMTMVPLDVFDAEGAVDAVRRHGVTSTVGAPTMWGRLLDTAGAEGLPSLRLALYGGAPMPRALQARMSQALPSARFGNGYGMTETTSMVCYLGGDAAVERSESVGPPLPVTELRLVDPESEDDVPDGEVGEIVVRGPQVAMGYWTGDRSAPLADDDGWLRTGDAGRLVDGCVVLADRLKDVVKRGGESVFSIEVEEALYQHPDILEAAVVGVPDPAMGERVLAVVVPKSGRHVDADEVRAFCRARVAGFKVPSFVTERIDLPRNAGGKVAKSVLKEEFAALHVASDSQ